jgi:hypothetical protein
MSTLWDGYDFPHEELDYWAQEISAAALDLPEVEREDFLRITCEGSDRLRRHVDDLLEQAWAHDPGPPGEGTCRPGDVVRDCIILSPIGRGGMGEVYKAIQRPVRRIVAIKVVSAGFDAAPAMGREAAVGARLIHPSIAADAHGLSTRRRRAFDRASGGARTWRSTSPRCRAP